MLAVMKSLQKSRFIFFKHGISVNDTHMEIIPINLEY